MFLVHPVVYLLYVLQDKHDYSWEVVDYCTFGKTYTFPTFSTFRYTLCTFFL